MKDKVIKLLIKRGNNEQESIKIVEDKLETALKMFPDAKPSKIAEVLTYI